MVNYFGRLFGCFPGFKTIPTSFLDSLSYEEQIQYLCRALIELKKQVDDLGTGGGGGEIPSDLAGRIKEIEQAIETLKTSVSDLSKRVSENSQTIQNHGVRIARLEGADGASGITVYESSFEPNVSGANELTEVDVPEIKTGTFTAYDI